MSRGGIVAWCRDIWKRQSFVKIIFYLRSWMRVTHGFISCCLELLTAHKSTRPNSILNLNFPAKTGWARRHSWVYTTISHLGLCLRTGKMKRCVFHFAIVLKWIVDEKKILTGNLRHPRRRICQHAAHWQNDSWHRKIHLDVHEREREREWVHFGFLPPPFMPISPIIYQLHYTYL